MRPKHRKILPVADHAEYERWRERVLTWPAPLEQTVASTVAEMPVAWQEHLISELLIKKARRSGPTHWSRAFIDPEELQ